MSTILVPVFALVGLNLRVLSRVPTASTRRSSSRRRRAGDFHLAKICSGIVAVFVVCNVPRLAIGGFEVWRIPTILRCTESMVLYWAPERQWFADFVARYLAIINSSINFLIYCLVGTNFRTSLMRSMGYPHNTSNDIAMSTATVSSSLKNWLNSHL